MSGEKSERKHRRDKSHRSSKRGRPSDLDGQLADEGRVRKKSKKHGEAPFDGDAEPSNGQGIDDGGVKTSRRNHKKANGLTDGNDHPVAKEPDIIPPEEDGADTTKSKKKHIKNEPESTSAAESEPKKTNKKKKHHKNTEPAAEELGSQSEGELTPRKRKRKQKMSEEETRETSPRPSDADAMDIDSPRATTALVAPSTLEQQPAFPFYTQTVSFYVPFYPRGFDKPITNITSQHLEPHLNHYSPRLRGVLLGYRNVNLSEYPVRADPNNPPTDQTGAILTSVDEYAVGFGWLTADVDLFMPKRGAWMEGSVNLQNEGHIGVVCWDKFNASIEAKRLPKGWRWVSLDNHGRSHEKLKGKEKSPEPLPSPTSDADDQTEEDMLDGAELEVAQMHTTGYWVDAEAKRVSGQLRFRIKNFDVGLAGPFGYLSIEGSMLTDEEEKALAVEEREAEQRWRRKRRGAAAGFMRARRVPEFSMTRFGKEEEQEDSGQRTVLYKGSRPGTPDD